MSTDRDGPEDTEATPGAEETSEPELQRVRRKRRRKMPPRIDVPTYRFWHFALAIVAALIAVALLIYAHKE